MNKKVYLLVMIVFFTQSLQAQIDTIGKYPYLYHYNWPETGMLHDSSGYCRVYMGQSSSPAYCGGDNEWWYNYLDSVGGRVCEYALYQHTDTPLTVIGLAIGFQSGSASITKEITLYDSTMEEQASVSGIYAGYDWDSVYIDTNAHHFFFPGLEPLVPGVDVAGSALTYLYYDFFDKEIVVDGDYYIGSFPILSTCMGTIPAYLYENHNEPYHFANPFRLRVDSIWSPIKTSRYVPLLFAILKFPCNPVDSVSVTLSSDGCLTADWEQPALQSAWTVKLTLPNGNEIIQPVDTNHWEYCGLATNQQYSLHVRSRCDDLNGHSWSDWGEGFTVGTNGIGSVQHAPDFTLTPNPASGTVTVGGFEGEGSVEIVDMAGRVSGQWPVAGGQRTIDISRLPAGSYVVRLTTAEGTASRMLQVE